MTSRNLEWSLKVANNSAYQSASLHKKRLPFISGQQYLPHVDYLKREAGVAVVSTITNTKVEVTPDLTFWFPDLHPWTVHQGISPVSHQELHIHIFFFYFVFVICPHA
jgi:hypothetical protein